MGYKSDPMGDRTNPSPEAWPTPENGGANVPPGGMLFGTGGNGTPGYPTYLVKALFVEGAYEASQPKGEIVVELIRDRNLEDWRPERYAHSISEHSQGAPHDFSNASQTYSQFETNQAMHAARDAFIDHHKEAILVRQREIENGTVQDRVFKDWVTLPNVVGWVSKDGNVSATHDAYFRLRYQDGKWREITGYPRER